MLVKIKNSTAPRASLASAANFSVLLSCAETDMKNLLFPCHEKDTALHTIDTFPERENVYLHPWRCAPGGDGGGGSIAGAIASNPPQPASLVTFLPGQESYPPEEPAPTDLLKSFKRLHATMALPDEEARDTPVSVRRYLFLTVCNNLRHGRHCRRRVFSPSHTA